MNTAKPVSAFSRTARLMRALRVGRGMFKRRDAMPSPEQPIELFAFESCPRCRLVRETLCELDLDFVQRSCPRGDSAKREELVQRGGKMQVPYLVDPNTKVEMYEARDIVDYLLREYATGAQARPS